MILDYFFLPVILLIGSVTSYQDYKHSKIKNKWILRGLVWALGVYLIMCLWLLLGDHLDLLYQAGNYITFVYIYDVFLNALISLVVGYLIWHFDMWSAGDAKLFFIFSLLLPLTHYSHSYLPYFPSFALFINVFIPAIIFLFVHKMFIMLKDMPRRARNLRNSQISWMKIKVYFIEKYPTLLKGAFAFIMIIMIFLLVKQMVQNNSYLKQWLPPLLILVFFGASKYFRKALKNNYVVALLLLIFSIYLIFSGFTAIKAMGNMIKNSLIFLLVLSIIVAIFSYSDKKFHSQKMPFAIWLFLGVIITLILKGSLTYLILRGPVLSFIQKVPLLSFFINSH